MGTAYVVVMDQGAYSDHTSVVLGVASTIEQARLIAEEWHRLDYEQAVRRVVERRESLPMRATEMEQQHGHRPDIRKWWHEEAEQLYPMPVFVPIVWTTDEQGTCGEVPNDPDYLTYAIEYHELDRLPQERT